MTFDELLMPVYHRLPPAAQNWAASWQGRRLRRLRYSADTEQLIAEAQERERWPAERLRAWSEERLAMMLRLASREVPYYREMWMRRRCAGGGASPEYLENWPVLEKEEVRRHGRAFLVDGCDPRSLHEESTSGTTGTPLRLWESLASTRTWYALSEARWRRQYGALAGDRWALFGGKLVVRRDRRRPPFWVWNSAANQLYVSSYHLAPGFVPAILDALEEYGITYIVGYTATLNAMAREALRMGRRLRNIKVVVTEAEPVYQFQRRAIEAAFACPVRETYGMCEHVGAASEGPCGRMHLWPEAGWPEVFHGNERAPAGESGDLVFTGLLNADMPLIRYRVGDLGRLAAPPEKPCECGSNLPCLEALEGRTADVLYAADGRTLSSNAVDIVFNPNLPIKEGQIVQRAPDDVLVRVVPAEGFGAAAERQLSSSLRERLGAVRVSFERLTEIPRAHNGKFKVVLSDSTATRRA